MPLSVRLNCTCCAASLAMPPGPSTGCCAPGIFGACCRFRYRSEEHTSELQSQSNLVCRLLLEKKKTNLHECQRNPCSFGFRCCLHVSPMGSVRRFNYS